MFTVFKNVTIPCVAVGEQWMFKKRITGLMWLAFGLIVASSLIGGANDLAFNAAGYAWMSTNCVVSAAYLLYMRRTIKAVGFADFDSVFYNNILAVPVLLLLSLAVEDWRGLLSGKDVFPVMPVVGSSFTAFAISYCTAWCARVVSSTTYSMAGALNKLPIAVSGLVFFAAERRVVNWGSLVSIAVAFASGVVYSVAQMRARPEDTKTPPLSAVHNVSDEEQPILMRHVRQQ